MVQPWQSKMAFEPHRLCQMLVLVGMASCASGRATPPAPPKPEADCRQTSPNLIHVMKTVGGQQSKKESYEFCVSREGVLLFDRGSGPIQRSVSDEQMKALKAVIERVSQKQSQEIAHTCTHVRSLLVEWMWSGKSFAAHEACDETQPVIATEVRDAAWRILNLDSVKALKK
jgi:hypothetical protein